LEVEEGVKRVGWAAQVVVEKAGRMAEGMGKAVTHVRVMAEVEVKRVCAEVAVIVVAA
jgi:hypothetical protein